MITVTIHYPSKADEVMFAECTSMKALMATLKLRGDISNNLSGIDIDYNYSDQFMIIDDSVTGERLLRCEWN